MRTFIAIFVSGTGTRITLERTSGYNILTINNSNIIFTTIPIDPRFDNVTFVEYADWSIIVTRC